MPELPEVETIVRGLRPKLVGARVVDVWWSGLPLRLGQAPERAALVRAARGGVVETIRRRGKYILLELVGCGRAADARGGLLIHLGMSGRLRVQPADAPREPHTHVVLTLEGGRELRFVDPRRFGCVIPTATPEERPEVVGLGPDPLEELDEARFADALATSRAPIKAFLLDQRRVAGLGNIYVCEALFRAGIHPTTPARRTRKRAGRLVAAIREALALGIENRGTTLRDYVDDEGGAGGNQTALLVYGREGKPCLRCGEPVRRRVDAARSTYFCARCQRR